MNRRPARAVSTTHLHQSAQEAESRAIVVGCALIIGEFSRRSLLSRVARAGTWIARGGGAALEPWEAAQ